jgi:hypothetical protein
LFNTWPQVTDDNRSTIKVIIGFISAPEVMCT